MLAIKLKRIGKKHQASYRLIVGERRHKMAGIHTEDLGWYNPHLNKGEFNKERIEYWMKVGAKLSDTVNNLLVGRGVLTGKKIAKHKQPKVDPNAKPVAAPAAAAPAAEAPKA